MGRPGAGCEGRVAIDTGAKPEDINNRLSSAIPGGSGGFRGLPGTTLAMVTSGREKQLLSRLSEAVRAGQRMEIRIQDGAVWGKLVDLPVS